MQRSCQHIVSTETMTILVHHTEPFTDISQLRKSCVPNLSCDQFNQLCSAEGKIAPAMSILLHEAKCFTNAYVFCFIIFYGYKWLQMFI